MLYEAEKIYDIFDSWNFNGFPIRMVVLNSISCCDIYGLVKYMKDRKNRITVTIKPTEAMRAIARKEEERERKSSI